MAYTINRTSGAVLATVADGTIDTTTDLTLIGKNYAGYGEILNENMIKLLENFANTSAPGSPISGQIWWDTTNSLMKVYTGTAWKTISSSTASSTQPSNNVTGDLWWDTTNTQLKVYNGTSFTLIGPAFTTGTGQSGPVVDTVTDSLGSSHVVVKIYVSDTIVAIVSKDAEFTPQTAISGFATVKPGYNLSTTISSAQFTGTASNASLLDSIDSLQFIRSDANDTTTGTLGVLNDTGLVVGADSDLTISVSSSDVSLINATLDGDIIFKVNDGGSSTTALTIDGATSRLVVAGNPTVANGVVNKSYVDTYALLADGTVTIKGVITPDATGTRNLGSTGLKFATVYATTFDGISTSAQYADVAENFSSDENYEPGTIVALGGSEEITKVNDELSERVFGVISTNPAHLMNAGLKGLPVALTGRCPVKIIGSVNKGDRLVSAGNGYARAALPGEATAFNVIGRALRDSDGGSDWIEAFVSIN